MVDAIKADFHTYLRKGVRIESVVGEAHADLDIVDVDSLLKIHFVLTQSNENRDVGVVDFVDRLSDRIRRLKTETAGQREDFHGEIRGHVDWHASAKRRSRSGNPTEPWFVCVQQERHFNIEENLVLKRLLTVIRDILENELQPALEDPSGYEWLDYWHHQPNEAERNEPPHERLLRLYENNVYLQRIDVEDTEITPRMIESVKRSRSELYRDAAVLLDLYRRLMRHRLSDEETHELLNHTMIRPEEESTLFELYWIFRLLNTFEDVSYRVIREDNPALIASWEDDSFVYRLYHDSTGEHLSFHEDLSDIEVDEDGYLYRTQKILEKWQDLSDSLLDRGGSDTLWGGRPDIVLEKLAPAGDDTLRVEQVFIGEVKYTSNVDYVATGLRELLEYMAFVRRATADDNDYLEERGSVLQSQNVKGLLFIDQLETDTSSPEDISILQFGGDIPSVL
ncbi:hypothetical protein EA472_21605 [Natrarchaeobius oligotrophus]|uniref:Uncharacterized protein n=1 Tax=Natrarchaeobius chitinivorans TaxID=1679083 RepID=A0A3N6M4Y0_NATCH|nr:hypothetical protein EA472_21605 [Natrarchaeobius chitinivorans]